MNMRTHMCIHGSKVHAEAKPLANKAWREGRYEECLGQLNRCHRAAAPIAYAP